MEELDKLVPPPRFLYNDRREWEKKWKKMNKEKKEEWRQRLISLETKRKKEFEELGGPLSIERCSFDLNYEKRIKEWEEKWNGLNDKEKEEMKQRFLKLRPKYNVEDLVFP